MVPGTRGREIVFALLGVAFFGVLLLVPAEGDAPRYTARGDDVDLAIVRGIRQADAHSAPLPASAVVVPHHLVAAEAIALGIRALASSSPRVVVILSPDHFGKCPTLFCTMRGSYQTFFGVIKIASGPVSRLLSHPGLVAESSLFGDEHGISAIVPFVKHYAPEALVVPIAISQKGRGGERSRAEALEALDALALGGAAFVVSTDFSHYLPLPDAEREDALTKKALCGDASDALLFLDNPAQSDCPLCLWLLREEAARRGFWNPSFIWHSNSAELLNDASARETTSHYAILFGKAPATIGACPSP